MSGQATQGLCSGALGASQNCSPDSPETDDIVSADTLLSECQNSAFDPC